MESGGKLRWRYDGRCGTLFILPDHYTVAQCDPDGENPCCSDQQDGRCGNTTDHCTCADCKDYKLLKDWEESDGAQRWRYDGKCGNKFLLPDNTPGQCYPDGKKPCCSDKWLGECGNTTEHCSCEHCTDYRVIYKDWRESEGTKTWRYDGRCGNYNLLPDGTPAQCDPDGDTPCCNDTWDGKCGNTTHHCSCKLCIDYKVIHEDWKEFGTNWRYDGRCGRMNLLPDGAPAQCDPDGVSPCCSDPDNGWCGNTTEHCSCVECTNYKFVKEWEESGGSLKWRYDKKCGVKNPLPDGSGAQCDPDGENPCCDDIRGHGNCGNTTEQCVCEHCVNYTMLYKDWRESGGLQKWRYDGKCGSRYLLPDGTATQCDPDGEHPCCGDSWIGECGNSTYHCSCSDCINYKFVREWKESGGKLKWRYDGKCGSDWPLPDGTPAECDPDGENKCCNHAKWGWCGNTTNHCSCDDCTDFKFERDWKKSGGTLKWRYDGKCGSDWPLPDGTPSQCDPEGDSPCCYAHSGYPRSAHCDNTTDYCTCDLCTDYRKIYEDWRDSEGKQKWRHDGKCGKENPLPDGTPAQCDPDGENPCCKDSYYSYEISSCGNSSRYCSCDRCIDYRVIYRDWRESEGKQKWRYDGWCGSEYPLPDGTPAECDPEGDKPCCNNWKGYGSCGKTIEDCLCEDCVDYGMVAALKKSGGNCTIAKSFSGFLKHVCFNETTRKFYFKCVNSDVNYNIQYNQTGMNEFYKNRMFKFTLQISKKCQDDPYAYQACGLGGQITDEEVLCGAYICEQKYSENHRYVECTGDFCKPENRADRECTKARARRNTTICDGKCDERSCFDEAHCNGYRYGIYCTSILGDKEYYVHASGICSTYIQCEDGSDQKDCSITNSTSHTCPQYGYVSGKIIPLMNYTRCSVFSYDEYSYPYCRNYLDQTNCSDTSRVGGYCTVGGYFASVSKLVVCHDFDPEYKFPIKICDDDLQNECLSPSNDCKIHKHRMCDGVSDCSHGIDETHDMCETVKSRTTNFNCSRSFNLEYGNNTFPLSWILDGTVDCMDGEDENADRWKSSVCRGEYRHMKLPGNDCQNAYKCPGLGESYVLLDQLCDGVESCGNDGENKLCKIARDFPDKQRSVSYTDAIRDLCDVSTCEIKKFSGLWGKSDVFGVTTKSKILVPTSKVNCSGLFGEFYLFLSCMNLCSEEDVTCPLDEMTGVLKHDSCPGQFPDRAYTIVDNSYLVFLDRSDKGIYHQEYYECKNSKCVEYKQVCDLVDDCGDMSDEINCKNHMICEDTLNSTKHQFIALSQRCDGIYDCFDLSDECNDRCGKQILENWALKIICWFMGTLALLFNFYAMVQGFSAIKDCETENMLTSKVLMSLISSGDFLIGLYLVIISVYDSIIMGEDFCRQQAEWLTGTICLSLGVISTFGSQISLFTMTVLSVIRMYGLIFKAMRVPGPVNKKAIVRVSSVTIATTTAALMIAVVPLIPFFEDYFVQGMYYDPAYKVFVGFPNKERHIKILQEYSEKSNTGNSTLTTSALSWKDIGKRVDEMFTQDHGPLTRTPVHFYGNDGLCLFKYFVRNDDARRSRLSRDDLGSYKRDPVVWTILAINFFCFVIITCCYIVINIQTKKSSQRSGQQDNPERLRGERTIQNKIMIIIATDFLCWVPFIIISALHSLDYIDASKWYASFAMTVLPLNSVINPLVYDKALRELITKTFSWFKTIFSGLSESVSTVFRRLFKTKVVQQEQEKDNIPVEMIGSNLTIQNPSVPPAEQNRESSC